MVLKLSLGSLLRDVGLKESLRRCLAVVAHYVNELVYILPQAQDSQISDSVKQVVVEWSPLIHGDRSLRVIVLVGVVRRVLLFALLVFALLLLAAGLAVLPVKVFRLVNLFKVLDDVLPLLLDELTGEELYCYLRSLLFLYKGLARELGLPCEPSD